jgi:hypothetical protein
MVKAYVGVANRCGLESFLLEGHGPAQVPTARARCGVGQNRACYWAAVRDDVAQEIRGLLASGERLQALLTLDAMATDIALLGRGGQRTSGHT